VNNRTHIGVIGAGDCPVEIYETSYDVGRMIGEKGWALICGGLGGVMEGAAKGCLERGGMTVGLLPGTERESANPFITLTIPTGLGEARNVLVVRASDVVIAIAGGFGTLSEIGLALKIGKPVIGLGTWRDVDGVDYVQTPQQAIARAGAYLTAMRSNAGSD
jgi:uncharacterized protein (TIGR00725 family)